MKGFCKCGKLVVEGNVNLFGKKRFEMKGNEKTKGNILRHGSNNPNDWEWVCPKCQSRRDKK